MISEKFNEDEIRIIKKFVKLDLMIENGTSQCVKYKNMLFPVPNEIMKKYNIQNRQEISHFIFLVLCSELEEFIQCLEDYTKIYKKLDDNGKDPQEGKRKIFV